MSESTNNRNSPQGTETGTATAAKQDTQADLANQLVADATRAQVKYEHEDAKADDWGKASFPASDPPQNY